MQPPNILRVSKQESEWKSEWDSALCSFSVRLIDIRQFIKFRGMYLITIVDSSLHNVQMSLKNIWTIVFTILKLNV